MYSVNMKAPDKIYLDIIEDDDIHMVSPSFENNGGFEYIRKDALVEWINQVRTITHKKPIESDLAFQSMLNHINEM